MSLQVQPRQGQSYGIDDDLVTKTRDESDERFTPRWGISICERLTGDSEVGKALHAVSHTVPYGKELEGETGRWTASK